MHVWGGFRGVSATRTCLIKSLLRKIPFVICRLVVLSNPENETLVTRKRDDFPLTSCSPKNGKCAHFSLTIYYQPLRIGISDSPSRLIKFQKARMKRQNPHLPSPLASNIYDKCNSATTTEINPWTELPSVSLGGVWKLL